jgi:hypothetical protein
MPFVKNTTVRDLIEILERLPQDAAVVPVSVVVSAEIDGRYTTTLELKIFGEKVVLFDPSAKTTADKPRVAFVDEYRRRKRLT